MISCEAYGSKARRMLIAGMGMEMAKYCRWCGYTCCWSKTGGAVGVGAMGLHLGSCKTFSAAAMAARRPKVCGFIALSTKLVMVLPMVMVMEIEMLSYLWWFAAKICGGGTCLPLCFCADAAVST